MSKNTSEEGPKIYVTSRGARYVKADEVLKSPKVRKAIEKMAIFPLSRSHLARLRVSSTNYFSKKNHPNSQTTRSYMERTDELSDNSSH